MHMSDPQVDGQENKNYSIALKVYFLFLFCYTY